MNSERYLCCKFLKKVAPNTLTKEVNSCIQSGEHKDKFDFVLSLLTKLHQDCEDDHTPLTFVPLDTLLNDETFMDSSQYEYSVGIFLLVPLTVQVYVRGDCQKANSGPETGHGWSRSQA